MKKCVQKQHKNNTLTRSCGCLAIARKPCYGLGIKGFFDNIPHQLINLIEFY